MNALTPSPRRPETPWFHRRLNVMTHRLRAASDAAVAAVDWLRDSAPDDALDERGYDRVMTAFNEMNDNLVKAATWLGRGSGAPATPTTSGGDRAAYDVLLGSEESLTKMAMELRAAAAAAFTIGNALMFVASKVNRPPANNPAPNALRKILDDAQVGLVADATWLTARAAHVINDSLTPNQANSERVKRHRVRRRENIGTATIRYHMSDLYLLRELGFLTFSQLSDLTAMEVSAAFEAAMQAVLAAVTEIGNDYDKEKLGLYSTTEPWGSWRVRHWLGRVTALLDKVQRGGEP